MIRTTTYFKDRRSPVVHEHVTAQDAVVAAWADHCVPELQIRDRNGQHVYCVKPTTRTQVVAAQEQAVIDLQQDDQHELLLVFETWKDWKSVIDRIEVEVVP